MFRNSLIILCVSTAAQAAQIYMTDDFDRTTNPTIGIVSQALSSDMKNDPRFDGYNSYIMAAYVKFMEGSGARVIPIVDTESQEVTITKMTEQLDGILLPGGGGDDDYFAKGRQIYEQAISMNDAGDFFPVWGTCLGFEYLASYAADSSDKILSSQVSHDISLTLDFYYEKKPNYMFDHTPELKDKYTTVPAAFQSHSYGLDLEAFETDAGLNAMFHPTSTSTDPNSHDTFVSSMESAQYPFFGTQFHPEKVLDQYNDDVGLNHTWESVLLNRNLADTFVQLARENSLNPGTYEEVMAEDIANFDLIVTDYYYGEVYVFP